MSDIPEVQNLLSEARILFENGQFTESLSLCYKAYELNPCPKLLRKIERIKPFAQGMDKENIATKDNTALKSTKVDGDSNEINSGECHIEVKTSQASVQGTPPSELLRQAKTLCASGDLKECLELLQRVQLIEPSDKVDRRIERIKRLLEEEQEEECDEVTHDSSGIVSVAEGFSLPRKLFEKLYPYQQEGVRWLWNLHNTAPGGVLADDMGLGKTVQVIAFLSGLFLATPRRFTALIIMPVSVLVTWEAELKRWAPTLHVALFHDVGRTARLRHLSTIQRHGGILLTTYGTVTTSVTDLATDMNKDSVFLSKRRDENRFGPEFVWDYLILDEAHKIKNPAAKTTKSILSISSKHRILLTGTAVQNNLKELWSLFNCTHGGRLLGRMQTFTMEYEKPITRAREKDATRAERAHGHLMAQSLRRLIDPFFLRRTKAEIIASAAGQSHPPEGISKLPKKTELVVWVYLNPIQERTYRDFLQLNEIKELLLDSTKRSPLVELVILKKLCDHPRLLSSDQCAKLNLETDRLCDSTSQRILPSARQLCEESGKLLFLRALMTSFLEEMAANTTNPPRCLIFSQSLRLLDMAEKVILSVTTDSHKHRVLRLDGRLSKVVDRLRTIEMFERDKSYTVMLLTTQVGGVGLTLTAANRVIILDPSWNPATDAQAVDRAYRIGQKSDVLVYRLITCGTVEEKIYRRQIFKDSVIRQTTSTGQNKSDRDPYRYFTRQDLRELFTLSDTRISKTQQQLASLHNDDHKWSDKTLRPHLTYLTSDKMKQTVFGLSFHDLMFSKTEIRESDSKTTAVEQQFLVNRLVAAEHAIARECAHSTGPLAHDLASLSVRDKPIRQLPGGDMLLIPSQFDSKRPMFNRPQLGGKANLPVPEPSEIPTTTKPHSVIEIDDSAVLSEDQLISSFREISISHQAADAPQTADTDSDSSQNSSNPEGLRPTETPQSNRSASIQGQSWNHSGSHMSPQVTQSPLLSRGSFAHLSRMLHSTPISIRPLRTSPLITTPLLKTPQPMEVTFDNSVSHQADAAATDADEDMIHMDITAPVDDDEVEQNVNMKSLHNILTKSGLASVPSSGTPAAPFGIESVMIVEDSYISTKDHHDQSDASLDDVEIIEDSYLEQETD